MSTLPTAEADVVVLGAGLAGHCAALAAAEEGATVLLLEKTATPGGSTLQSAGSFAWAATDLQAAAGIDDSPEMLASDLQKAAGGIAEPALVALYVRQQAPTYDWLRQHGARFHRVSLSGGTSVPRTHATDPHQVIGALHARVRQHARIDYQSNTAATRLLTSGAGDEVTGIEAAAEGDRKQYLARGGVVLATGGFTRNRELLARFAPQLDGAAVWGGEGNSGDGLKLASELGAELVDMQYVMGTFGVALKHYPETTVVAGDELLLRMAMYRGGIAVNLTAQRFADESQSYKTLAALCLAQPKAIAIQVFDQRVMGQSTPQPTVNDLQGAFDKGVIFKAATLTELAAQLGLDPPTLEATVARYNDFIRAGDDQDFGRRTLGGGYGKPLVLETAPWYALPCSVAVLSTYCGVRVDAHMCVQRANRRPIPRLYAAGEIVGGFHGMGYMSGSSLGKAAIFGRVAGEQAARWAT